MKVVSSIFPLEKPRLSGRSLSARTLVHWLLCRATLRITLTATRQVEPIVSPRLVSEETLMIGVSVRAGPCISRLRYLEPKSSLETRTYTNFVLEWIIHRQVSNFWAILVSFSHAAQGDGELAGTAMETSMTTKLRVTLHKAGSLPTKVATVDFPLLETSTQFVIHGFAYNNYLDQLDDPSTIFQVGATLDLAMADCYIKTRNWLMDVYGLTEEETIAMMSTAIDFGITQVVDGNWGVHADIDKWIFDESEAAYDYSCTTSKTAGRRHRALMHVDERRRVLEEHMVTSSAEEHANGLFEKVTGLCVDCNDNVVRRRLADRLLDAKLKYAKKKMRK